MRVTVILLNKVIILFLIPLLWGCGSADGNNVSQPASPPASFNDYWYQGEAELTRYRLEQGRYGEIHEGDAVLIFVTEDFWTDKQVKYEFGPKTDAVQSVLKLNFTRKFYTGIYPYSIMNSIFTPVNADAPATLKVTASSQEWCGQTFMQLNYRNEGYDGNLYSYFQGEGDRKIRLPGVLLEDELWTRLRLNPDSLPVGKVQLIPGLTYLRLRHKEAQAATARADLTDHSEPGLSDVELQKYTVRYSDISRSLTIIFEKPFPHRIVAWEEETPSGFGGNAKTLKTRAVKTHSLMLDYWSRNAIGDSTYRKQLGL